MSHVSAHAETVQSGAIALEGDLAAFQYLKRQCWRRVVEDDNVEAIGGHVSGKASIVRRNRVGIAARGAVDQNRDVASLSARARPDACDPKRKAACVTARKARKTALAPRFQWYESCRVKQPSRAMRAGADPCNQEARGQRTCHTTTPFQEF
jgi:hypothetical protein